MDRLLSVILVLVSLLWITFPAEAQNPFSSKGPIQQGISSSSLPRTFLAKIAFWQQQLNQKMSKLIHKVKETGSVKPLMTLIIIAFAYGVLHATGPGHGKVVALSYIISQGNRYGSSIVFGNLIALFHGMSGACLVLILHFILQKSVMRTMGDVSRITQLISYSLIALLGIALMVRNLSLWIKVTRKRQAIQDDSLKKTKRGLLGMALVVGMIPCPGVMMVMLFSLSLNMIALGLLLAVSITIGMAMTITAVVIIGLSGKNYSIGMIAHKGGWVKNVKIVIESGAAFMIAVFGALFFAAAL